MYERVMRRLIPKPPNPPRLWQGNDVEGAKRTLRILRYGDCSWREADWGHHMGRRPGYPLVLGERLEAMGVSSRFSDVYVDALGDLPQNRQELTRFVRLDGAPDLVLVQIGSAHAVRTAIPARSGRWNDFKMQLTWRTGRLAIPVYKLLHPTLRNVGKLATPYPGTGMLPRFIELARAEWPNATVVMMSPACRSWFDGFLDPAQQVRVWSEIAAVSRELGVEVVDTRDAIDAARAELGLRAVNGLNGYDLRRPGHEAVADLLMPHVERRLAADKAEPVAATA